ncbi:thermonuclease family protein, partial [Patescibacteria group bacterium]|nr:thermonuclease family protein [Patescibacteria group bacterium]
MGSYFVLIKNKLFVLTLLSGIFFLILAFIPNREGDNPKKENSEGREAIQGPVIKNTEEENTDSLKEEITPFDLEILEVIDGDTVVLQSGEKIRLLGINTPEKDEPFSNEATQKTKELVLNKKIRMELDIEQKDRYGRTLAYVFTEAFFVNEELVKAGYAVSQTIPPNVKYQDKILNAERSSRSNCLGMWKDLCFKKDDCIKISGLNPNAKGNDNLNKNGEWVKIANSCSKEISMNDWVLRDSSASNRYVFKNFSLKSNKFVKIYSGCGLDSESELYWICPEQKNAVWNNDGDHAFLNNSSGELISDFLY